MSDKVPKHDLNKIEFNSYTGEAKEFLSDEGASLLDILPKSEVKAEMQGHMTNWLANYQELCTITEVDEQTNFFVDILSVNERMLHNFGIITDELKIVSWSEIKGYEHYQPVLKPKDYGIINSFIYPEDEAGNYRTIQDSHLLMTAYLKRAFILNPIILKPIDYDIKCPQAEVDVENDKLWADYKADYTPLHNQLIAHKNYSTCQKVWLDKKLAQFGGIDTIFGNYDTELIKRRVLPIRQLLHSVQPNQKHFHHHILEKVMKSFKFWFNNKYSTDYILEIHMEGTRDNKVPMFVVVNRDEYLKNEKILAKKYKQDMKWFSEDKEYQDDTALPDDFDR